jgi:hypothetical protein
MRIATIKARRRALRVVGAVAAVVGATMAGDMGAAPGTVAMARTANAADLPNSEKPKLGTLTVEVSLVDSDKSNKSEFAAGATVSIVGRDDRHTTNDKGRTIRFESPIGAVTLQIKVIGVDLCRLQDVSLTSGDQVLSVLVDKAKNGKCRRLE